MRRLVLCALCAWFAPLAVARAEPPARLYVLAIGNNSRPLATADPRLRELRYADDDAAAFAAFAYEIGAKRTIVLSNFDADTARRFPAIAGETRPPLAAELARAVRELNLAFERDRAEGRDSDLLLSYSGHGVVEAGGPPALTLADAELTREQLFTQVLAQLKARFVHVVIDACHGAAVVRARDAQAKIAELTAGEAQAQLARVTLRGLPLVGALIASSASAEAQEWDDWQHGVFTHEVLSGLRGGADVNGDLKIEYSEMAAFLSAANREVGDPKARMKALVKAPEAAARAAIVDLTHPAPQGAFLVGRASALGRVWIADEDGSRIADVFSEVDQHLHLLVPAQRRLFVLGARGEAAVTLGPGQRASFENLTLRAGTRRKRGALELSLQRGLFAVRFGPAYYRGYVDSAADWVAVPLRTAHGRPEYTAASARADQPPRTWAWTALGASGALLVAAAACGIAALDAKSDFDHAQGVERFSTEASQRFDTYRGLLLGAAIGAVAMGGLSFLGFSQP